MLTVIDVWNREYVKIEVDRSLTGSRVAHVLKQLRKSGRFSRVIQANNGTEFISKALDAWAHQCNQQGKVTSADFLITLPPINFVSCEDMTIRRSMQRRKLAISVVRGGT